MMAYSKPGAGLRPKQGQLELAIKRKFEHDRNFHKGGRSFYFFDFDDNIACLNTLTYVFHKDSGKEMPLSSGDFARFSPLIGRSGDFKDFEVSYDDEKGSFRNFRDKDMSRIQKLLRTRQPFVEDLLLALGLPEEQWKGPSWGCFYHAVFNQRPVSVITARGHEPDTIKAGIREMKRAGFLPAEPNYLSLFPVNHPPTRRVLGQGQQKTVAELKQAAIRASVEKAVEVYGDSPFHRFGMSDDDPTNLQLIIEEMARLKKDFKEMSFFVIDTHGGQFVKREVFEGHTEDQEIPHSDQLTLL